MAITLGSSTVTVQERTHKIEIATTFGADPSLRIAREKVMVASDNTLIGEPDRNVRSVERNLSQIATKTVNGMTGADLAAMLSAWADALREEDIKAAAEQGGGDPPG